MPTGARFTTAAGVTLGTDNGDGSWSFTPAQLAGLHFVPVLNLHGTVNLTLEATATEASNGSAATTTRAFSVTVDAQADAPTVGAGSQTINEDVLTVVGTGISYGLTDGDGSERVSSVTVTGFPGGAAVTLAAVGSAVVTPVAGGYTITGPSADIRATLDGLAVRPPVNSDADIPLTVAVTTTDADGSTATASNTFTLNVSAIADAPTVSGSASGNEDAAIAVPGDGCPDRYGRFGDTGIGRGLAGSGGRRPGLEHGASRQRREWGRRQLHLHRHHRTDPGTAAVADDHAAAERGHGTLPCASRQRAARAIPRAAR